ncbi:MAG: alpha/beta hydrolase [Rhizobiales bacterium]|nr:alpha/beta hydrolase [Hyphomicrobiales bacterium]
MVSDHKHVDFVETGTGPAVLFVPGSFAAPPAWRGVQKMLPQTYRFVATSICGYGGTAETRTDDDLDMEHQFKVLEAVAERIGEPFHLVGHSFGGAISLASALNGTMDILSITTFEANPLGLIKQGTDTALFDQTRAMSDAFEAAYFAGEPDAASRIIDFWGGAGSFASMPEIVLQYCRDKTYNNVLDWRTAYAFDKTAADYAALSMPVLLVRGALANRQMVTITNALAAHVPRARSAIVGGASHFLITSHAKECAKLLGDFLAGING